MEPETRYPEAERNCLALIYPSQRLRYYFLTHKLHLMVKSDPLRYRLTWLVLFGQLARWLLQLLEFDITCIMPKVIKSQAVIDLIAQFNGNNDPRAIDELLGKLPENTCVTTKLEDF